jgi:CubicO group peptidase (beta-lactamase class C family)
MLRAAALREWCRAFALLLLIAEYTTHGADPFDWQSATPQSQGMSSDGLEVIRERMAKKKTKAFLVICNDRIVCEWYAPGVTATTKHGTASLAKALVGGMSLAVAMQDGKIALDDPAAKFIPQWKDDVRKSKITIRHLGSHTSGLSDSTTEDVKHEEQPGWMGDFWKRLDPPRDPFTLARDETPVLSEPGARFQYSNPGIGLLTYCVTSAIRDDAHKDARTLLRERILRPIGVPDTEWSVGYGKTFTVDDLPLVGSWGGGSFTPRATARIGRLVLREGTWEGRPLLSREIVRQVTTDAGLIGNCGMGWWSNGGGRYGKLPKDAVWGAGAGDQLLLVVPGLNLIMVRNGETLAPGPGEPPIRKDDVFAQYHDYRARILFEPLAEAVTNRGTKSAAAPYPPSQVIRDVQWAAKESIVRRARGSDNWPMTWGDDDLLYTAYGDGNGFEPFVPEKLSMGFATVAGMPPDFSGINLRAASAEAKGDGAAGRKASGLLMVNGVLYLWARNAGNAQLAWSADHGATWTWSDWKFTNSFGCPTFLDFGRNYAGARDKFVYVYSPDDNSAYNPTDEIVLARVPQDHLREVEFYEFFAGIDGSSQPNWTRHLSQRRAAFTHPGRCYRPRVTYNAPLKRYLLVHPVPNTGSRDAASKLDTRFNGGLALFDAPEPWGPWTTVFLTERWDVGPGDSASFPSKWISNDGRTLHLVFAGDDCFAVRRAILAGPSL